PPAAWAWAGTQAGACDPPARNGVCVPPVYWEMPARPPGVNGHGCPNAGCPMAAFMQGVPLVSALDQLPAATGWEAVLDAEGLHHAGVPPTVPVTVQVQGMPLHCALNLMLRPHRLEARVCGDVIHVTCTAECRTAAGCGEKNDPAACEEMVCP